MLAPISLPTLPIKHGVALKPSASIKSTDAELTTKALGGAPVGARESTGPERETAEHRDTKLYVAEYNHLDKNMHKPELHVPSR